jgi:hypothetical protein
MFVKSAQSCQTCQMFKYSDQIGKEKTPTGLKQLLFLRNHGSLTCTPYLGTLGRPDLLRFGEAHGSQLMGFSGPFLVLSPCLDAIKCCLISRRSLRLLISIRRISSIFRLFTCHCKIFY